MESIGDLSNGAALGVQGLEDSHGSIGSMQFLSDSQQVFYRHEEAYSKTPTAKHQGTTAETTLKIKARVRETVLPDIEPRCTPVMDTARRSRRNGNGAPSNRIEHHRNTLN